MATYRELHGKAVKTVTTNPTDDAAEGQIWFNSTDNTFKSVVTLQSFSSTGVLNTARGWMGSAGDKTAGIVFGGSINPYPIFTTLTEEYNGTGWSVEATCPSALGGIGSAGVGTQTAALQFGANGGSGYTNNSAHYNGSSWTAGGNMNTTGRDRTGGGIQTAAIGANAYIPGSQAEPNSETYNGSAWTAISGTGSARYEAMGFGTQTAFATCGGRNPPTTNLTATEEYDGSSWTTGGTLPQGTHKGQGAGTQTAGTIAGGVGAPYYPNYNYLSNKVDYDGSTWAISPATMTTARAYYGGDSPSGPNFYTCGGTGPSGFPYQSSSEEFNVSANIITSSAWASGGALGSAGYNISGCGTQTAGLGFARYTAPNKNNGLTEEYDGSTWSEQGDLSTGRMDATGFGVQTAAVCAGGKQDPGSAVAGTEEYGGASWSSGEDLPAARRGAAGIGILTAGIVCGGEAPGITNTTLAYDGTDYSSLPTLNTARTGARGSGTSTAGLICGGTTGSITSATEEYNGSAWSNGGSLLVALGAFGQSSNATQDNSIAFGGTSSSPLLATTFGYDGTAWSTRPNMSTARFKLAGAGTEALGLAFGGTDGPTTGVTNTEEFTGETTSVNVKTLTQS